MLALIILFNFDSTNWRMLKKMNFEIHAKQQKRH